MEYYIRSLHPSRTHARMSEVGRKFLQVHFGPFPRTDQLVNSIIYSQDGVGLRELMRLSETGRRQREMTKPLREKAETFYKFLYALKTNINYYFVIEAIWHIRSEKTREVKLQKLEDQREYVEGDYDFLENKRVDDALYESMKSICKDGKQTLSDETVRRLMRIAGMQIPSVVGLSSKAIVDCFLIRDREQEGPPPLLSVLHDFVVIFKDIPSSPFYYKKLYRVLVRERGITLEWLSRWGLDLSSLSNEEMFDLWDELLPIIRDERPEEWTEDFKQKYRIVPGYNLPE